MPIRAALKKSKEPLKKGSKTVKKIHPVKYKK